MNKFIKKLKLLAILCVCVISVAKHKSLMAADNLYSSVRVLEPDKMPFVGVRAHNILTKMQEFAQWFKDNGGTFLQEKYPFGLPASVAGFVQNNPITAYQFWYKEHYEIPMIIETTARTTRGEVQQELGGELVEAREALLESESRSASQVMAYESALAEKDEALKRQAAEIYRLTTAMQALEVDNTILKATMQPPRYASASRARTVGQPPITEEERQFRMQSPLKRMALSAVDDKDIGLE